MGELFKIVGSTESHLIGFDRDGEPLVKPLGDDAETVEPISEYDGWYVGQDGFERFWIDPRGEDRRF